MTPTPTNPPGPLGAPPESPTAPSLPDVVGRDPDAPARPADRGAGGVADDREVGSDPPGPGPLLPAD
jgi:hypothetical protein